LISNPKISVILPVYNAEKYLAESIQSILDQSFTNFELIIINDGSVDDSEKIIKSFNDERIVYVSQTNQGLAATLNRGILMSKASYVARQDNDDISLPDRLKKQLLFFEQHPEYILLGTKAQIMDENGLATGRFHYHPTQSKNIKFALLFNNPFVHSSVMFKKEAVIKCGLYDTNTKFFEDYNLWSKLARIGEVANLNECLLKYREVNSGMSKTTVDYDQRVKNQSKDNIRYYCPEFTDDEVDVILGNAEINNSINGKTDVFKTRQNIFNQLVSKFCLIEKINEKELTEDIKRLNIHLKRQFYNQVINSELSNFSQRLKALALRKLLFILHKKYL